MDIVSDTLGNALNLVLALYPSKFINTKHARRMDLINAKKQARGQSLVSNGAKVYVIVDEQTGECSVNLAPLRGRQYAFQDGQEVEVSNEKFIKEKVKEVKETNKKIASAMETKTSTPAKKVAKKVAPKKVAKKVVAKKVAKKATPKKTTKKVATKSSAAPAGRSALKAYTIKEIRAMMGEGKALFVERGARLTPGYVAKMKDPDREILITIAK